MNYGILVAALIQIESGGDCRAVGDGGASVGCLQIQVAAIKDVNRVYGRHYLPLDRYNQRKSEEICRLYLMHYGAVYERQTGQAPTQEVLSRIWNGGPTGWRKASTERYWKKVSEVLDSQLAEEAPSQHGDGEAP